MTSLVVLSYSAFDYSKRTRNRFRVRRFSAFTLRNWNWFHDTSKTYQRLERRFPEIVHLFMLICLLSSLLGVWLEVSNTYLFYKKYAKLNKVFNLYRCVGNKKSPSRAEFLGPSHDLSDPARVRAVNVSARPGPARCNQSQLQSALLRVESKYHKAMVGRILVSMGTLQCNSN